MKASERAVAADVAYAIGLLLGVALLVGAGSVELRASKLGHNDWSELWAGPRVYLAGLDPYDAAHWVTDAPKFQGQVPLTPVYGYPAWTLIALLPLAALGLELGGVVWTVGGIALGVLGLRALLRAYAPDLPAVHTLCGLTLLVSQPAIVNFYNGQWGFILVGLVSLSLVALRRRSALSGVAFAIAALAKPQLFLASVPALGRVAAGRGATRALAAFVATGLAALAVSLAVMPHWLGAWLPVVFGRLPTRLQATTLPTALNDLAGLPGLVVAVAIVVALVLATLAFDPRGDAAIPVAIAAGSVAAPYTWSYDQLLLVVPIAVAAGVVARVSPRRAVLLAAVGAALLLLGGTVLHGLFADARRSESYNGLIPAAVALLVTGLLWPLRNTHLDSAHGR